MAGVLEISENVAWMPAGWVFDGVLELIAAELSSEYPSLAAALLRARTDTTGYCDLRGLDAAQFRALLQAVERAYTRLVDKDTSAFHDARFQAGFMQQFRELKALLHVDARGMASLKT